MESLWAVQPCDFLQRHPVAGIRRRESSQPDTSRLRDRPGGRSWESGLWQQDLLQQQWETHVDSGARSGVLLPYKYLGNVEAASELNRGRQLEKI